MGTATEQQFCLKWNNHRSTLFSVFDNLLEEESLVDVTLSADGQFIRAHRVILSACSPYFRNLFRSSFLNDKHPVVFMKDVDFENLKSLVEYMYKGEANVPQNMLASFIRTAESLQIRGLAECATKQLESEGLSSATTTAENTPTATSTPATTNAGSSKKERKRDQQQANAAAALAAAGSPGGILAARLASGSMFDFPPEILLRHPGMTLPLPQIPPPMKKPRKSSEPKQNNNAHFPSLPGFGPIPNLHMTLPATSSKPKKKSTSSAPNNNNYDSGDDNVLKIDEDADGKENRSQERSPTKNVDDDIAELDVSNGVSTEEEDEEEPSMPGPGPDISGSATGIVNPWTGEPIQLSEDQDRPTFDDSGLVGWHAKMFGGELSSTTLPPTTPSTQTTTTMATPPSAAAAAAAADNDCKKTPTTLRLKRLNRAAQMNAIAMCQTADGPKFRCKKCNRVFNLRCTVLRHVRHQHEGRFVPHPCEQCGQVFKRTDHLKVHKRKIHNMVSSPRPRIKREDATGVSIDVNAEEKPSVGSESPSSIESKEMTLEMDATRNNAL